MRRLLLLLLTIASSLMGLSAELRGSSPFCLVELISSKPAQIPQAQVDRAIDLGAKWLLEQEEANTERSKFSLDPGRSSLALYAVLKSGVDPESPTIQSWLEKLDPDRFSGTYDTTCLILALAAIDPVEHWGKIRWLAYRLVEWQNAHGDWGYPSGADLSNTQYAALGLWKAEQFGIRVGADVWRQLANCTLEYQDKDGSFGYSKGGSARSASMTAAGAGTLAICETQLRLIGELDYGLAERMIPARNRAKRWLGENLSNSMQTGSWRYYFFYGLERLGALAGQATLLNQNWYQLGAQAILDEQNEDGSWSRDPVTTCFAILFLARATAADHGSVAVTGVDAKQPKEDEGALCWLKVEGEGPMTIQVDRWNRSALREYEWPKERGLGPRIGWVEYLCDGEGISVQLVDSSQPLGNRFFKINHHFRSKGAKKIQARFHLEVPPGSEHLSSVIESNTILALVQHSLPNRALIKVELLGRKLNLIEKVRATSTSNATARDGVPSKECKAIAAVDGNEATAWVFKPSSKKRKLTIRLNIKDKIQTIQILACQKLRNGPAYFIPLRLLEVKINHKNTFPVIMESGASSGILRLDEAMRIYHVEVRVLTMGAKPEEMTDSPGLAGISEIYFYSLD